MTGLFWSLAFWFYKVFPHLCHLVNYHYCTCQIQKSVYTLYMYIHVQLENPCSVHVHAHTPMYMVFIPWGTQIECTHMCMYTLNRYMYFALVCSCTLVFYLFKAVRDHARSLRVLTRRPAPVRVGERGRRGRRRECGWRRRCSKRQRECSWDLLQRSKCRLSHLWKSKSLHQDTVIIYCTCTVMYWQMELLQCGHEANVSAHYIDTEA